MVKRLPRSPCTRNETSIGPFNWTSDSFRGKQLTRILILIADDQRWIKFIPTLSYLFLENERTYDI